MAKKKNKHTATVVSTLPPIKDYATSANQGIILINQAAIQDVYKKSGPLAPANEFQVHYWFLNLRFKAADDSILDIAIPTCYFNYKQEVTSASIDFDLKDVKELSAALLPIHTMKVNELLASGFKSQVETLLGVTFEMSSADFGSIHKHPGGSHQSFSATDLTKDASEPGVVYPLAKASDDAPNFAGIMYASAGSCDVAHFEYRTVNGELGTDIEYIKGRCAAIIVKPDTQPSTVEQLFGIQPKPCSYSLFDKCVSTDVITSIEALAYDLFQSHAFAPSTDAISPANLTRHVVAYPAYSRTVNTAKINPTLSTVVAPAMFSDVVLNKASITELNSIYKAYFYYSNKTTIKSWVPVRQTLITNIKLLRAKIFILSEDTHTRVSLATKTLDQLKKIFTDLKLKVDKMYSSQDTAKLTTAALAISAILELQSRDVKLAPTTPIKEDKYKDFVVMSEAEMLELSIFEVTAYINKMDKLVYGRQHTNIDFCEMSDFKTIEAAVEEANILLDDIKEEIAANNKKG